MEKSFLRYIHFQTHNGLCKKYLRMQCLIWFILICTAIEMVDTKCNLRIIKRFCNEVVPNTDCDLKTHCNVNFHDKSTTENFVNCSYISSQYFPDRKNIWNVAIVKYKNDFYISSGGKLIYPRGVNFQHPLNPQFPVLWGNKLLIMNKTKAYEVYENKSQGESLFCRKDRGTGDYYFKEEKLFGHPAKGLKAGGTQIKIYAFNTSMPTKVLIEPINKNCSNLKKINNGFYCTSSKASIENANITFILDYVKYYFPFKYLENPHILSFNPNSSYYWGQRHLKFQATTFSKINRVELSYENVSNGNCTLKTNTIECLSPSIDFEDKTNITIDSPNKYLLTLKMDTYVQNISLDYFSDPTFENKAVFEKNMVKIKGRNLDKAASITEYKIISGTVNCTVDILTSNSIICKTEDSNIGETINISLHSKTIILQVEKVQNMLLYYVISAIVFVIMLVVFCSLVKFLHGRYSQRKNKLHFIFTEDNSQQLMSLIVRHGIPFHKPSDYIKRVLWIHKPTGNIPSDIQNMSENLKESLSQFEDLLKNKYFLLPATKALERNKSLTLDDKFNYSYHLSLLLLSDLRYFLELCEELFVDLVSQNKGSKIKKLMLSCSSITEFLILNWFGISMYSFMKDDVGDLLFFFSHDLKSYLEKMPIDEVTGNTYQYLFDKYRLRKNTKYEEIQIQVEMQGIREIVSVFTCDTIIQLKKKCLAAFYRGKPASEIPDVDDICVESNRIIFEEFKREETNKGFTQHLTVDNWNIQEDDLLILTLYKVSHITEANSDDRYTTLGSSVARITTKSNRKFMHLQEPEEMKSQQVLTKMDLKRINLPTNLEYKLRQLIYKFLDSKSKPAPKCCLYNLFKKASQTKGNEKTWFLNCYFIKFCCQFIAEPNIILDINQELYTKKNLEGVKNYAVHMTKRCLKKSSKDFDLNKSLNCFLSGFSQETIDIKELMSTLQNISKDIMRDISFSKESSLYHVFKMMKTSSTPINSALSKDNTSFRLRLGDKFINIIEQIEIGQTKRDNSFSH